VLAHFQDSGDESTIIRFMLIQPKSLQECTIIYEVDGSLKLLSSFVADAVAK
jgi:hypothetical protein